MAKRDVETATIAVAAFNGDVKEEEDFVHVERDLLLLKEFNIES